MSKSLNRVLRALEAAELTVDMHEMPASTRTAAEAAAAVGCALDQIAKSIIFRGEDTDRVYLFLTAGGNQVNAEMAQNLAGEPLGRADAAFVRAKTGFAIGGVAPIGHKGPVRTFFDPRLNDFPEVWAAGGTPRHVFALSPANLLRITNAQISDFI